MLRLPQGVDAATDFPDLADAANELLGHEVAIHELSEHADVACKLFASLSAAFAFKLHLGGTDTIYCLLDFAIEAFRKKIQHFLRDVIGKVESADPSKAKINISYGS